MIEGLNKESLLLLYAADELPAADRAAVERMLAGDADLRGALASLQGAMQSYCQGMAALDADGTTADTAAVRRIGQVMRQRLTDKLVAADAPAPDSKGWTRYPWWAYPAVGAAVVLVSFLSWWGTRPDRPLVIPADRPNVVAKSETPPEDPSQLAASLQSNFELSNPTQPEKSVASLDAAEDQIAELSRSQSEFRYDGSE